MLPSSAQRKIYPPGGTSVNSHPTASGCCANSLNLRKPPLANFGPGGGGMAPASIPARDFGHEPIALCGAADFLREAMIEVDLVSRFRGGFLHQHCGDGSHIARQDLFRTVDGRSRNSLARRAVGVARRGGLRAFYLLLAMCWQAVSKQ